MRDDGPMTVRLGFIFVPSQPPERLPALARTVEAAGFDDLWVWEDCFKESGIASAAIALAVTERIHVGIGLLPAPLRNVALTAMEATTIARTFPGRFTLGVGHGVQSWMGQAGARVASPLTLLREYTLALRALLGGERVTTEGRYVRLDDVALDWPPTPAPPIMLGGGGPKSIALTGEVGDGTLLAAALTVDEIADAARRSRAARPADATGEHPVVAALIVATGDDGAKRARRDLDQWRETEHDGSGAAGGSAEAIADAVRRFVAAGATTVAFQPTTDEPDLDRLVEFLATEVRPLLADL